MMFTLRRAVHFPALAVLCELVLSAVALASGTLALDVQQKAQILTEANEAYSTARTVSESDSAEFKQLFELAASKYQTLVDSGIRTSRLFFNLGNAYLGAGQVGRAIANYERAALMRPGDPTIQGNLVNARALLSESTETRPAAAGGIGLRALVIYNAWLPARTRFLIAVAAWCALWGACIGRIFWRSLPWRYLFATSLGILLVLSVSLGFQWWVQPTADTGIVVAETSLREGDSEAFALTDAKLHEGQAVRLLQSRQHWVQVESKDGETGWLPMKQIELIPHTLAPIRFDT